MATSKRFWFGVGLALALGGCSLIVENEANTRWRSDGGEPDGSGPDECGVCGANERCGESGECECAPGFARGGLNGCVFTRQPADAEIDDPSAWRATGATISGGVIDFPSASLCDPNTHAETDVQLGAVDPSTPLALAVQYRTSGDATGLEIILGDHRTLLPPSDTQMTRTICLGARSHGATALQVRPGPACSGGSARVARVAITDGSELCSAEGVIADPGFETGRGWTFDSHAFEGTVARDPNRGQHGGSGVRMRIFEYATGEASFGEARTLVVWPQQPSRLEFWSSGTGPLHISSTFRGVPLPPFASSGPELRSGVFSACVPPWLRGMGTPLRFHVDTEGESRDVSFDDVAIAPEPECGGDFLLDGDFDIEAPHSSTTRRLSPWRFIDASNTYSISTRNGRLEMRLRLDCGVVGVRQPVLMPTARGATTAGGPAIRFRHANSPLAQQIAVRVDGQLQERLAPGDGSADYRGCIPASLAGRVALLELLFTYAGSACPTGSPLPEVWIDDVVLYWDETCSVP